MTETRVTPAALDTERSVLGSMMIDDRALETGLDMLTPAAFHKHSHAATFGACARIAARGDAVDPLSVAEDLRASGGLVDDSFVLELSEMTGCDTSPRIEGRCRSLLAKAMLRDIISAATTAAQDAYDPETDPEALMGWLECQLSAISAANDRSEAMERIGEVMSRSMTQIKASVASGRPTGVSTGYSELDEMTTGLHAGDLIIVAGRPSMGKTAFGLSLAISASRDSSQTSAFYSLEMSKTQIAERIMTLDSSIEMHRMRSGRIGQSEIMQLESRLPAWNNVGLYVDDTPGITIQQIRSRSRRLKKDNGLAMIVIDYLQLMGSVGRGRSRNEDVAEISKALKSIAKELSIPVVALSQLSRAVEARTDHRPQLSDLRESGAIEQDADLVMFLYRDEYYHKSSTKEPGVAEIIVGKQRNGPVGYIKLAFQQRYVRFSNLEKSHEVDPNNNFESETDTEW